MSSRFCNFSNISNISNRLNIIKGILKSKKKSVDADFKKAAKLSIKFRQKIKFRFSNKF